MSEPEKSLVLATLRGVARSQLSERQYLSISLKASLTDLQSITAGRRLLGSGHLVNTRHCTGVLGS